MIPYGRQFIDEEDIRATVEVLSSDWLTTGPKVVEFEEAMAQYTGTKYGVAVSNGTAALHCAMYALGIRPGDEVIVPSITFVATANSIVFQGGTPVFADINAETMLIDPDDVEKKITEKSKAIIAVDYAGQPCDYDRLQSIAEKHGLKLVADSCHALGAEYKGRKTGGMLADLTVFSFHPVKHITTGEGGMIVTNNEELAGKMRLFRNHGINNDFRQREKLGNIFYEMVDLGYNYRITDIQCVLGLTQLKKLPTFLERRREIATIYDNAFSDIPEINPLKVHNVVFHAYHLYVVRIDFIALGIDQAIVYKKLREKGIGVCVHYYPVHLMRFYQKRFGTSPGLCPTAEKAYQEILSLPIYPGMDKETNKNVASVISQTLIDVK